MAPRALPLLSLSIVAFVVVACSSGTTGSPSPFGSGASPTDPKDGTDGSGLGAACTEYLACCEELAKKTPQLAMSCEATKTQIEAAKAKGIATSSFEASCKSGVLAFENAGYCKPGGSTQPVDRPEPKKCVPSCTKDSDCANSCPAITGGVQCCDTDARVCFGSKTATCPKPDDGPSDPPPTY